MKKTIPLFRRNYEGERLWELFRERCVGIKVIPVNLPNCVPIVGEIYDVGMQYYPHTGWFPFASVKFKEYDRQICLENLRSVANIPLPSPAMLLSGNRAKAEWT